MKKAIFLDRDGVINKKMPHAEYVTSWEKFKFLPNSLEAIKKLSEKDYMLIVITNQRGISTGKLSEEDLNLIHKKMIEEIESHGGRIDAIYFCPHGNNECDCRKPKPGMILSAAKDHNIDLMESWMFDDCSKSIEAGKAAGCNTFLIDEKTDLLKAINVLS